MRRFVGLDGETVLLGDTSPPMCEAIHRLLGGHHIRLLIARSAGEVLGRLTEGPVAALVIEESLFEPAVQRFTAAGSVPVVVLADAGAAELPAGGPRLRYLDRIEALRLPKLLQGLLPPA